MKMETLDLREQIDRGLPVPVCMSLCSFHSYSLSPLFPFEITVMRVLAIRRTLMNIYTVVEPDLEVG